MRIRHYSSACRSTHKAISQSDELLRAETPPGCMTLVHKEDHETNALGNIRRGYGVEMISPHLSLSHSIILCQLPSCPKIPSVPFFPLSSTSHELDQHKQTGSSLLWRRLGRRRRLAGLLRRRGFLERHLAWPLRRHSWHRANAQAVS